MGGCVSSPASGPEEERSKKIDQEIKEEQKRMNKEVKLLLLGAGQSGKSTCLKQWRILSKLPFTEDEIMNWRELVFENVVTGMRSLVDLMDELNLAVSMQNRRYISLVDNPPSIERGEVFPSAYLEALRALWDDPQVQSCWTSGFERSLPENLIYFYAPGKLESLFQPNYKPDNNDILRARARTLGVHETVVNMQGGVNMKLVDVGGQRSERRKWASCFDNVSAILFLISTADYNQGIIEDLNSNGLVESMLLAESVLNSQFFTLTAFIMFFNKADLLAQKMADPKQQIKPYFPDFDGKPGSFNDAIAWMKAKFRSLNHQPDRELYMHVTTATDTQQLAVTIAAVNDVITRAALRDMAII